MKSSARRNNSSTDLYSLGLINLMIHKYNDTDIDLCLKQYRAPRYRILCMIVLVEISALVAQVNDVHFLKQRIFTKTLT